MSKPGYTGLELVIGILFIVIIASSVLPSVFDTWFDAPYYVVNETTGETATEWPAMLISIWELIPLFAVLGLAFLMYRKADI